MNEKTEKDVINIKNMIYEIDGKKVMLDTDLANYIMLKLKELMRQLKITQKNFQIDICLELQIKNIIL